MKKLLALFLCLALVITSFNFNLAKAATITAFNEDFEEFEIGDALTDGTDTKWQVYDEGQSGYWKTHSVGTKGWFYNNNGSINVSGDNHSEVIGSQKAALVPAWVTLAKEIEVSPNTDYSLSFNFLAETRDNMDFFVLDATNVNSYSFKAYTAFSPVSTANKVKAFDNTLLTALSQKRDKYTAGVWQNYTTSFSTGANTTKILFVFATEGNGTSYLDDISLTYEFRPEVIVTTTGIEGEKGGEATAQLSDNDTKITYSAFPYDTAEFLGWYKNGALYNSNPVFTEDYNPSTYIKLEAKFNATAVNLFTDNSFEDIAAGTKYSGNSVYHWVSGRTPTHVTIDTSTMTAMSNYGDNNVITTSKAYSGTKSLSIPINGHYVYKIVKVEKNTDYRYSFYYYQENYNLFYNNKTGMKVIGLDYENLQNIYADEIDAEDGTETILHVNSSGYGSGYTDANGNVLQARLNTYPQSENLITRTGKSEKIGEKATVGAWDKAEFIFNSGDFEYIALPFSSNASAGTNTGVYIDHVTLYKRPEIVSDYSFAVVGDQQKLTGYHPDKLHYIYDHLIDNAEEKNLQFVMNMGDICEHYDSQIDENEWILAREQMDRLNGVCDYTFIRGNHDDTDMYNKYFPIADYTDMVDGSYSNNMLNTYQKFEVGGVKYLVFSLDIGVNPSVMQWVKSVVENHPDYNVIYTTHSYLGINGLLPSDSIYSPGKLSGGYYHSQELWDNLFSQYSNTSMVLCGHISADHVKIFENIGVNNNKIYQMLIDPQGMEEGDVTPVGMVAYFHFTENGKKLYIEYYSTIWNELRYEAYLDLETVNDNNTYSELTVNAQEGGYVKVANGQLQSNLTVRKSSGTTTLYAEEIYGNEFLGWYEGETLITNEKMVTVNVTNKTITAKFKNNNLLENGSFENYLSKKQYLKSAGTWENITTSATWGSIGIVENVAGRRDGSEYSPYSGSKMLLLSNRNAENAYITLNTEEGKDYEFNMKWLLTLKYGDILAADGVTPIRSQIGSVKVTSADGQTVLAQTSDTLYGSGEWENFNIAFNSGTNESVRVNITYYVDNDPSSNNTSAPSTGELYIDDLSLTDVTAPAFTLGDIDGKNGINNSDLIMLRRYLAGWGVEINEDAANLDGKGGVNNSDAIWLARHLAGWDGYELD